MRIVIVTSLLFAAAACAAEQPAPAPAARTNPPAEEGIAAAKREFEAVKAARDGMTRPEGGGPRLNLPTLETAPVDLGSLSAAKKKAAFPEKKSANWLVEAMNKEKKDSRKERDRTFDSITRRDSESGRAPEPGAGTNTADKPTDSPANTERPPDRSNPAPNPLNSFLADWMTPQDYALLQPSLRDMEAGSFATRGNPVSAAPDVGIGTATVAETSLKLLGLDKPAAFMPPETKENPYLQAIDLPAPAAPVFAAPAASVPMPPVRSTSNIFAPPPSAPPSPAKIPEFVRPLPDEKHFKQLRRF